MLSACACTCTCAVGWWGQGRLACDVLPRHGGPLGMPPLPARPCRLGLLDLLSSPGALICMASHWEAVDVHLAPPCLPPPTAWCVQKPWAGAAV